MIIVSVKRITLSESCKVMDHIKIGVIREGKIPVDKRTPLTPEQAQKVNQIYPNIKVVVQSSSVRVFTDEEYQEHGIEVVTNVDDCDILLGVKEVPLDQLIDNKTYLFFSHTIKKQPYNQPLLSSILSRKIRLIDYECLTDEAGKRIIAFGRYAGIVGSFNTLWTFGKRYNLYSVRRPHECYDLEDLKHEYSKIVLPPIKIALTGGGRVSKGAMEVLMGVGIRKVTPHAFLAETFNEPVFTQLNARDYNRRRDDGPFNRVEFYQNPELYESDFEKFTPHADILIAGAFWDPNSPVLFHREDILVDSFNLRVIGDITCDIRGSIPSTIRPTTIEDPIYDYDPSSDEEVGPVSDEANITVMAVDNLPCELSRDASKDFGDELINNVLPSLVQEDTKGIIERATITNAGSLTPAFEYLSDYAEGKA